MDTLLNKFGAKIKGVIEGFDRIVFKGQLKPFCYIRSMISFPRHNKILYKDYYDWITAKSIKIRDDAKRTQKALSNINPISSVI